MADIVGTSLHNAVRMLARHKVFTPDMTRDEQRNIVNEFLDNIKMQASGVVAVGDVMDYIKEKKGDDVWMI